MIKLRIWKNKMGFYNKFVGISDWPLEAQRITQIYGFIGLIFSVIVNLTSTFLILYILDALGFKLASIVITVMISIQLFADYPTGALADHIGQRWVLVSAIFLLSMGVFLLAYATTFMYFAISGAIIGFANAEASGALKSWYDNNYHKFDLPNDPEKKDYGYTMNRTYSIQNILGGITFIIGGILATTLGRANVFIIEAIIGGLLTIFVYRYMTDLQIDIPSEVPEEESKPNFIDILKGGIAFLLESKINMILIIGFAVIQFAFQIWRSLLLFPVYFGYSGSDTIAGFLRSIIYFISTGIAIAFSEMTKKIDKRKLILSIVLESYTLFGGLLIAFHYLPVENKFSLAGIIIVIVLFTIHSIFDTLSGVLIIRFFLDFIPSKYRNSLYSFVPTLVGIIALYFMPLTGALIETNGLQAGLEMCLIFVTIGLVMMEIAMRALYNKGPAIEQKQETSALSIAD